MNDDAWRRLIGLELDGFLIRVPTSLTLQEVHNWAMVTKNMQTHVEAENMVFVIPKDNKKTYYNARMLRNVELDVGGHLFPEIIYSGDLALNKIVVWFRDKRLAVLFKTTFGNPN